MFSVEASHGAVQRKKSTFQIDFTVCSKYKADSYRIQSKSIYCASLKHWPQKDLRARPLAKAGAALTLILIRSATTQTNDARAHSCIY